VPADEAGWTRAWFESAVEGFGPLLPESHAYPQAPPGRFQELLADPGVSLLVAEEDRQVAGFTGCGENRDSDARAETGEIRSMFVAPRSWRRGVGRALLAAALDDLRARGYSEVSVWSFAGNERANAFYEAAGFTLDGAERSEDAWAHIPELRYRRSL
jgi:GNAT superfamily N-acetyltransferase